MKTPKLFTLIATGIMMLAGLASNAQTNTEGAKLKAELKKTGATNAMVENHLVKFDTLDFKVFTNQEWTRLHESHAKDIKVVMPDGSVTIGLEAHINTLNWTFSFAPDTRIIEHPIRFGSGNYTAVTGYMLGTFTQPMVMPDGTKIPPTGKAYKLPMVTVGIWKNGVMIEEQLYYDNLTFMKQLGLAK